MRTLTICLLLLVITIAAISIFRIPAATVFFTGVLLVCPLLHVVMMRDGSHKH